MSGYQFEKLKLLVVDADQHSRKLAVTLLRAFGVGQIAEASTGNDAWAMSHEAAPDIILLDWQMAGMTGLEFVKMIRRSEKSPNRFVPIILLTADSDVDHMRRARDAGVNEFLAKPISVRALLSRLACVIEQPRAYVRTRNYFGPSRRLFATDEYRGPELRDPDAANRTKKSSAA